MRPFGLRLHYSLPLLAAMLAILATVLGANLMTMSAQSVTVDPSQGGWRQKIPGSMCAAAQALNTMLSPS